MIAGGFSLLSIVVAMVVAIWTEPHMEPEFFEKAADLFPLLLVALVVQHRYLVFRDEKQQSPLLIAAVVMYAVIGEGATLLAIGDPGSSDSFVKWTLGGLAGLLAAMAASMFTAALGLTENTEPDPAE